MGNNPVSMVQPGIAGQVGRRPGGLIVPDAATDARFLLWVDGVGGFLVCPMAECRLGQAVPGNVVEVPLLADVSRSHAAIVRDGEGYLLRPQGDTTLHGATIIRPAWLGDGAEIGLGRSLRMRFRRPHPLSATARLEMISHHQTRPTTSAVLLAAETCVLGPGGNSHVVCPDWPAEVVLVRRTDGWSACAAGSLEIDGRQCFQEGRLTLASRVAGEQFSFALEAI